MLTEDETVVVNSSIEYINGMLCQGRFVIQSSRGLMINEIDAICKAYCENG